MRTDVLLLIVALVLVSVTDARAGELCPSNQMDQFRKDAFQYPKAQREQIIKAATDLELQLRGKLSPPYLVCAGMAHNIMDPQVEVWTGWEGKACDDRYKIVPKKFEGQNVTVYCKNMAKFM
jgi:hypothetical protein